MIPALEPARERPAPEGELPAEGAASASCSMRFNRNARAVGLAVPVPAPVGEAGTTGTTVLPRAICKFLRGVELLDPLGEKVAQFNGVTETIAAFGGWGRGSDKQGSGSISPIASPPTRGELRAAGDPLTGDPLTGDPRAEGDAAPGAAMPERSNTMRLPLMTREWRLERVADRPGVLAPEAPSLPGPPRAESTAPPNDEVSNSP